MFGNNDESDFLPFVSFVENWSLKAANRRAQTNENSPVVDFVRDESYRLSPISNLFREKKKNKKQKDTCSMFARYKGRMRDLSLSMNCRDSLAICQVSVVRAIS